MKIMKQKNRKRLIDAAMGRTPCDLSIENVQLVNVVTAEIYPAAVDVVDGVIVRVRTDGRPCTPAAAKSVDGEGRYLLPGFIDTHMHVESSMLTPENFGKIAVTWGTTTAVTDPHEIGNVMGIDGVKYMIENARKSPLRLYTNAPSCVPSVPGLEGAGAAFFKEQIAELMKEDEVIGVAELMDYYNIVNCDPRMLGIMQAGEEADGFLQGHAPSLTKDTLCAYLSAGIASDHESSFPDEVLEKLRLGMHIDLVASSIGCSIPKTAETIKKLKNKEFITTATDDVTVADQINKGHVNHIVDTCIEYGIDPMDAIRFGTINGAREYQFSDIGIIAPGYVADMQLVDDLTMKKHPAQVYVEGRLVAEYGKLVGETTNSTADFNINTVNIPNFTSPDDFAIAAEGDHVNRILLHTSILLKVPGTKAEYKRYDVVDGKVVLPEGHRYLCVVNRHGSGDMTTGICDDFDLLHGCVGATVAHDSHNLTLAYSDPKDAFVAAKELKRIGGGIVFVENGEVVASLALPVAGLMSPLPAEELLVEVNKMEDALRYAFGGKEGMMLAIAVLSLPCYPGVVITDRGVVDGDTQSFVPIEIAD